MANEQVNDGLDILLDPDLSDRVVDAELKGMGVDPDDLAARGIRFVDDLKKQMQRIDVQDPERAGASDDDGDIAELHEALAQVYYVAPPNAVLRGWTEEQRAEVFAWSGAYYRWLTLAEVGDEPPKPAHLKRALDFLENGTLVIGGGT